MRCGDFTVIIRFVGISITFNLTISGIAWRIISKHVKRVLAEMETSLATLNFSFLFVILSNLVLEVTAFQVFVKALVATNHIIFLIHSFLCY